MRNIIAGSVALLAIAGCQTPGQIIPDDMHCGTPDGKHHKWTLSIQQHPLVQGPSYYYRANKDYVVLVSQESLRAKYTQISSDLENEIRDPQMLKFVQDVLVAPRLQSYQDLYEYTLPEGWLWGQIRYLVVSLILDGEATIVDPSGIPVGPVVVVRSKGPGYSATTVNAGDENGEQILTRVECIT